MRGNSSRRLATLILASWWNRSPLVISTTGYCSAMAATDARTPSISSTGWRRVSWPMSSMRWMSLASMRWPVMSMAASIIDSTMPFTP
ncbi:hypothetical protein G6F23_015012 [Rhizopus arrhizus]|nr:hypothetical protein G6F23_015012 [Rhizopus arrhizus]